MKRFWVGKSEEGHDRFSIPLQPDEEGMIGRECPNEDCQPRYFKIALQTDEEDEGISKEGESAGSGQNLSQAELTCPYCGRVANMQEFHTRDQIEWVKSLLLRDVHRAVQRVISRTIGPPRPTTPRGFFSVRLEYKPGRLPDVRPYVEDHLKGVVQCDKCLRTYAVYGISFQCPLCGGGNLLLHLERSYRTIESLLEAGWLIKERGGEEAVQHHLGNCLEDVVSLFEGFLKAVFQRALARRIGETEARDKVARLKTTFQRLTGAEETFRTECGFELFAGLSREERDSLEQQFLKRHVITHNLGLVDERYQEKAKAWQRLGQEIPIEVSDIKRSLALVDKVVRQAAALLEIPREEGER